MSSLLIGIFFFVFRLTEFSSRRRYSDFEWLRNEIERAVQINLPDLPPKAYFKQIPLLNRYDPFEIC